ncbi:MAG: rhodanese-like domain-containing protein [Pseudomonadota bacterium]
MTAAVLGVALVVSIAAAEPAERISAPDAYERAQSEALTIIDIRRPEEWAETGLPAGAARATLQDEDFVDRILAAVDGDKTAPIALTCRTGRRSERAARQLSEAGFTKVYNLREGWLGRAGSGPGWKARGLPVETYEAE